MAAPTPTLQRPPDAPVSVPEPRVFVMPERYRGGAAGLAMAEPKKPEPTPVPVVARPPAPLPPKPQPPKPAASPAHGSSHGKAFVLVGIFVLLALGIGGFFVFRTLTQPAPTQTSTQPVPPIVTQPVPPTTTEPEPTPPPSEPFPTGTRPGLDTDTDGLSDLEERLVYLSDPGLPDTDADGFLDGNEVFHGYDPLQPSPATLVDAARVRPFVVEAGPDELLYSLPYPAAWSVTPSAEDPRDAVFAVTTGETLTVSVEDKADAAQTLEQWYAGQGLSAMVRPSTTKSGVRVFRFDTGIKGTIDYLQTFKMMLNGLELN